MGAGFYRKHITRITSRITRITLRITRITLPYVLRVLPTYYAYYVTYYAYYALRIRVPTCEKYFYIQHSMYTSNDLHTLTFDR